MPVPVICQQCKKEFLVRPYRAGSAQFCSPQCWHQSSKFHIARPFADRVWEKIDKTTDPSGHWMWMCARDKDGYGLISLPGRHGGNISAHRATWMLTFGSIPKGIEVCHSCDIPQCVNPHHLFLGTHRENMQDAVRKNRMFSPQGIKHPLAKFTEEQILTIRQIGTSMTYSAIAAKFGVDKTTIGCIIRRKHWVHI